MADEEKNEELEEVASEEVDETPLEEQTEPEAKTEPEEEPEPETEEEPEPEPEAKPKPLKKSQKRAQQKAQRASEKEAPKKREEPSNYVASPRKSGVSGGIVALVAALSLVAGLLLGHFLPLGGSSANGGELTGVTTITEEQLDGVVGTITQEGETIPMTAREVILSSSTLEDYANEDGTYNMPSADAVLSYARNTILNHAVEAAGITVTDEDVTAYAEEILGDSDIAAIAEQYGMDVETATTMIRESAGVRALYDQIVSTDGLEPPVAPEQCEEGKEDEPTAEYGAYVVSLLGDEWDAEANDWASQDGPYYAALSAESFTAEAATYNQAMSAYYVAYQVYATEYTNVTSKWTDYVNDLFSGSSIEINSLVS